jgi:hypothetical protein
VALQGAVRAHQRGAGDDILPGVHQVVKWLDRGWWGPVVRVGGNSPRSRRFKWCNCDKCRLLDSEFRPVPFSFPNGYFIPSDVSTKRTLPKLSNAFSRAEIADDDI